VKVYILFILKHHVSDNYKLLTKCQHKQFKKRMSRCSTTV